MKTTIRILGALALAWAADASADWTHCAKEGEICRFQGPREVSYGAGKKWFVKVYSGGVKCDSAHFGGDPIQGTHKTCRMRPVAAPAEPQVEITSAWKKCAGEGGVCKFNGQKRVAYGTDGKYRQRVFSNGTKCTNEAFGGDPVPGRVKVCLLSP